MSASAPLLDHFIDTYAENCKPFRGLCETSLVDERQPFLTNENDVEQVGEMAAVKFRSTLGTFVNDGDVCSVTAVSAPDSESHVNQSVLCNYPTISCRPDPISPEAILLQESELSRYDDDVVLNVNKNGETIMNAPLVEELLGENERLRLLVDQLRTQLHEQSQTSSNQSNSSDSWHPPIPQVMSDLTYVQCKCKNWLEVPESATTINCPVCNTVSRRCTSQAHRGGIFDCILRAFQH
jgi:LSD1 subclass zinc finger protein